MYNLSFFHAQLDLQTQFFFTPFSSNQYEPILCYVKFNKSIFSSAYLDIFFSLDNFIKTNNINYPCIDISVIKEGLGDETLLNYVFQRGLGLRNNHFLPKINLNAIFMLPTPRWIHTVNISLAWWEGQVSGGILLILRYYGYKIS